MKISSKIDELDSLMEAVGIASAAHYVPLLSELNVAGVASFVDRSSIFTSASELAMKNLDMLTRPLDFLDMPDLQLGGLSNIVSQAKSAMGMHNYVSIAENLGDALTVLGSIAEQMSMSVGGLSGIIAATEEFQNRLAYIDSLGLDNARFTSAVGLALQRAYESKEYKIKDIPSLVAGCYEVETEKEKEVLQAFIASAKTEEKTEVQIKFSTIVWKIVLFILTTVASSFIQTSIENVMNDNPPVINQYYIQNITNVLVVEGYDVDSLNEWGYRIVNRDVLLRAKPGKSSFVTGRLSKGSIVRVISKKRKWQEVTWKDQSGEMKSGWVQNYKLSIFVIK